MSKRRFFPILGTLQTGGGGILLLETLMSDPDSVQKALPHPPEGFLVFFGPGVGGSAAWGTPHHRALVALGRSWRICQRTRVEPAEPNFRADAHRRLRRITWLRCHRRVGLKATEWGPAASEIYSLCFFEQIHGIMEPRFFLGASGEGVFPKAPAKVFPRELLPISTFHFV